MRCALMVLLCAFAPTGALAQPAYVGASLLGDISRFTEVETEPPLFPSGLTGGGETLGFGLTLGTALGERWGVELEFVLPGTFERSFNQGVLLTPPNLPTPFVPIPYPVVFPPIEYRVRIEERHTTLTAGAWFKQSVGRRAELRYLGGVAFARISQTRETSLDPRILAISIPLSQQITEHSAGPMVGVEGHIRLTEHLALTTGLRLLSISVSGRPGWLIRPGVGLQWRF